MNLFDTQLLVATITATNPIVVTAFGELVAERAGVINIGIEGMMLTGAFWGFWGAQASHSLALGALIGIGAGALLATIMASLTINLHADQIVVGIGINILALGMTTFANAAIFPNPVTIHPMSPTGIPGLERLPALGPALFHQVPLDYMPFLALPAIWYVLYRTNWGLVIRATGEAPEAVHSAGVSVARVRWLATVFAGAMAGLGGTMLTVGGLGLFDNDITAGRGLIALAAVIFGGWRPLGVIGAAVLFGATDALQLRLQPLSAIPSEVWLLFLAIGLGLLLCVIVRSRPARPTSRRLTFPFALLIASGLLVALTPRWQLPSEFWLMLPYAIALIMLAALSGRTQMPSALAQPFPHSR